ncbi:isoprenylcysteine carboxyl methyltransferase family protein [Mycolicibacterium austroafricanum]|uniref:isoprenylcysteine carboxyl methyltransferase family protein n=1 Tax=Mycolicibacterium austroafricanum TaxID=39687 RepID=UPI001ABFD994|nr:isoprenylcysteine carboxyl methyltransferase family protein [Mycolicibacterium austroafricanum]QRZ08356.1 isoprenylcysteine carboxyl methyltransferase family protein [Mycolicibacterium austroafricanum]QZT70009.1 isoprenylcysteine carboxyl methyltransferase family protein [Mycolicibacterium austroafricanum]
MWYYLFIALVAAERLVELAVSRRNAQWSFAHGGKEFGRSHYPAMVSMHALLLVSCIVEVATQHRPFLPWLGWPMVALVAASTAVRWWCVATLGKHWNPRLIVIPGAPLVRTGPYRLLHHPNYTAVAVEVAALPLVHSAWWTAVVFSLANAAILRIRIHSENLALGYA